MLYGHYWWLIFHVSAFRGQYIYCSSSLSCEFFFLPCHPNSHFLPVILGDSVSSRREFYPWSTHRLTLLCFWHVCHQHHPRFIDYDHYTCDVFWDWNINCYFTWRLHVCLLVFYSSPFLWSAMVERFSALDLCSDGRVVNMWVWIVGCDHGTCVLQQDTFTRIASLRPGVDGYLWGQSWLLCLISPMRRNGSNWSVYSPGSCDGFRNDLCAWWAGVIMYSILI